MLLQHRQNGFGGKGNLYVHGVMHSVRVLTDGSGETASTLKIVSDVTAARRCDEAAHADRDSLRAAHLQRLKPVGSKAAFAASAPRIVTASAAAHFAAGPMNDEAAPWRPHRES